MEGRGHGNQDANDDSVPDRAREGGKLVRDVLRRCEGGGLGTAVCGRGADVSTASLGMSLIVDEVSNESCFEACGDVTMVMAG